MVYQERIQGGSSLVDLGWVIIGGSRVGHHERIQRGHYWRIYVKSSWGIQGGSSLED